MVNRLAIIALMLCTAACDFVDTAAMSYIPDAIPKSVPRSDPGVEAYRLPATGKIFYVNANSGSDANDGLSPDNAWQNLTRIHRQVLKPGDHVRLARNSTWVNQHILLDNGSAGAAGNPVLFEAYGQGDPPTIAMPIALWSAKRNPIPSSGLTILSGSYITVLDLRIQDGRYSSGIDIGPGTHHIVIGNTEVQRFSTGISLGGSNHKILSCYIHDIGTLGNTNSGIGLGFGNDNSGTQNDIEIAWNRFVNCKTAKPDGWDGGAIEYYGRKFDQAGVERFDLATNIKIHHNIIYKCLDFMEGYGNINGMEIAYNLYLDSHPAGLEFHMDDSEHGTWTHECTYQNIRITNNTFYPDLSQPSGWGIIGFLVDWNHLPDQTKQDYLVTNNLFITNYRVFAFSNSLGNKVVHTNNAVQLLGSGAFSDNHNPQLPLTRYLPDATDLVKAASDTASLQIRNRESGDLRPLPGSPLSNSGAGSALFGVDLAGQATAPSGKPGIGCYEASP